MRSPRNGTTLHNDMADSNIGTLASTAKRAEQTFPTLTASQIERVASRGRARNINDGEVLFDAGDEGVPFFVVTSGELEIIRPEGMQETIVVRYGPGQFTGEINMLSGRRALNRARVRAAGTVIELGHEAVLSLVQTDSELSDILNPTPAGSRTAFRHPAGVQYCG